MRFTNDHLKLWLLLIVSAFSFQISTLADISATVTPGYQFSANEKPTTDKLNLLARPTIYVFGTLGGTNVAIGANTINGNQMVNTFVDGVTLDWDTNSPRRAKIKDGGVSATQVSTNLLGQGLTGGNGSRVAVHAESGLFKFSSSTNYSETNTLQFNPTGLFYPVYTNQTTITNGLTNYYAYTNTGTAFLYTNLPPFGTNDRFAMFNQAAGTNLPVTLGALYQYFTNINALPSYSLARVTFGGTPRAIGISNVTTTSPGTYYFYVSDTTTAGLPIGTVVSLGCAVSTNSLPAAAPTLNTNTPYWLCPILSAGSTAFRLYTNRTDCLASNGNYILPTGTAGSGQNTMYYITNYSSLGVDVIQSAGAGTPTTAKDDGNYWLYFRTNAFTTNFYVLPSVQQSGAYAIIPQVVAATSNYVRVATTRYDNTGLESPKVQVSIQPE